MRSVISVKDSSATGWDSGYVGYGTVIKAGDNAFEFWYSGGSGSVLNQGIGYAFSSDGITWVKDPDKMASRDLLLDSTSSIGPRQTPAATISRRPSVIVQRRRPISSGGRRACGTRGDRAPRLAAWRRDPKMANACMELDQTASRGLTFRFVTLERLQRLLSSTLFTLVLIPVLGTNVVAAPGRMSYTVAA
jgi:hypothetical protein